MMPWASKAGNLSNTGSPRPIGIFFMLEIMQPPVESFYYLSLLICYVIKTASLGLGHLIFISSD